MFNKIKKAIHHLLNPHCTDCKFDEEQLRIQSRDLVIDEYRELLASARLEIGRLTQALVDIVKPNEIVNEPIKTDLKPLPRKLRVSELVNKLNRESHEQAMRLRGEKAKETDELNNNSSNDIEKMEKKLGVQ